MSIDLPADLVLMLRGNATCYVATIMPDGSPQMTQTWVDTDGRNLIVNTVRGYQKAKNLERDPRIALTVSNTANPSRYHEVRGRVSHMTTDGGTEHIELLSQRYLGAPYPWFAGRDQQRLILTITPEKINTMG